MDLNSFALSFRTKREILRLPTLVKIKISPYVEMTRIKINPDYALENFITPPSPLNLRGGISPLKKGGLRGLLKNKKGSPNPNAEFWFKPKFNNFWIPA